MTTEAGIIGKIGLNSSGVGVCLNAIRTKGVDFGKLPIHLALRAVLNSSSAEKAIKTLQRAGVASAGHILIADTEGAAGLECSALGIQLLPTMAGSVVHTNHFLLEQPAGVHPAAFLEDSPARMTRIAELLDREKKGRGEPSVAKVEKMLDDEQGFPCSINRASIEGRGLATLFSIVMDLKAGEASVRVGRPTEGGQRLMPKAR
jgi:isopenicillin-N N-acyltransferase like protein